MPLVYQEEHYPSPQVPDFSHNLLIEEVHKKPLSTDQQSPLWHGKNSAKKKRFGLLFQVVSFDFPGSSAMSNKKIWQEEQKEKYQIGESKLEFSSSEHLH
jgi:hypothetical protein